MTTHRFNLGSPRIGVLVKRQAAVVPPWPSESAPYVPPPDQPPPPGEDPPPPGDAVFTRVRRANADGKPASATFSGTPAQGHLLVAVSFHRSSSTTPSISGSGWTLRALRNIHLGEINHRRGLAVWTKVAGLGEPTNVQTSWNGNPDNRLVIEEYGAGTAVVWEVLTHVLNDNGLTHNAASLSTGTTVSVGNGDLLNLAYVGIRNAFGGNISNLSWSGANIGTPILLNGGSNGRSMGCGFGQQSMGGAKSSTASWNFSASGATGEIAVLLVVRAM